MSGIQTFKYKRRKITVIFWNATVWFKAKDLYDILGYKEGMSRFMTLLFGDNMKMEKPKVTVNLISELGLYTFTYHKGLKPRHREKAQELYDWVQKEIMPVFDDYIKSWL